jgi:hypothetical protein
MFSYDILLGMFFIFFFASASIWAGWNGFANSSYATFFTALPYMFFRKQMSICSFFINPSDEYKTIAIDVIFWFCICFTILMIITHIIKKRSPY